MNYFFITGLYRSGTTLLEKLISSHPNAFAASQPFPYLFFHAKRQFYNYKNLVRQFPLGDLFLEKDYSLQELNEFLAEHNFTRREIKSLVEEMEDYPGFWSPWLFNDLKEVGEGKLIDVFKYVIGAATASLGKSNVMTAGSKEILTEEFILHFLENGIKIIQVIRDPRDVITSLNFGKGTNFTGTSRPTLFNIRNWRKSAAFGIALAEHPNCMIIRYEDLVTRPVELMSRIFSFLSLPVFEISQPKIRDQNQNEWLGNSSFFESSEINKSGVGRFKNLLSKDVIRFTEAYCYPEMNYYNYALTAGFDGSYFDGFKDPFGTERPDYLERQESFEEEMAKENRRLELLKNKYIDAETGKLWFLFPEVHTVLNKYA